MNHPLDEPGPVRRDEQLDEAALVAYLSETLGESVDAIEVQQFPGGHSNLTYLVRIGNRDLVLRRPPFGSKVKSAHDMSREYRMLEKLSPAFPQAPRPVVYCDDASILGADFYLMERISGVIIRKPPLPVALDESTSSALCRSMIDTLASLHAVDYASLGLSDFGRPDGYVQRQIEGWTRRYHGSQTGDVEHFEEVAEWLAGHLPEACAPGIIHNDFKFDNLVLDPDDITRIVGILDWEMTTLGDPLMDLGSTLSYWVEAGDPEIFRTLAFGPTESPGMYTRRQLADRYAEATGRSVREIVFYFAYGLFKSAVVVQQIYYRYHEGLTRDKRFASFGAAAGLLFERAASAIDTDTV